VENSFLDSDMLRGSPLNRVNYVGIKTHFTVPVVDIIIIIIVVRDFSTFIVCPSNKYCPTRCAYAANAVGKDLDIFAVGAVSLYHIL
jgi:hypothetical protein